MRITVITVAYNALYNLRKTAESILRQDYPNTEYIIIDGGSSDGTKQWLMHSLPSQVRWISEPDKGIYDAMNKGVTLSTGEYCIFMNAGDIFVDEHVISSVITFFNGYDVVYGDIKKNGVLKQSLSPRNCHKMYYCHQSVFTRTACLHEFPFDITHRFSADFKQSKLLFLSQKSFLHIPVCVADFDTTGISNSQRSQGLWDNIRVVNEVDSFVDKARFLPRLFFQWFICKCRGK